MRLEAFVDFGTRNIHTSVGDGSLEAEGKGRSCKGLHYQDGSR
jgi:hypothetical protein